MKHSYKIGDKVKVVGNTTPNHGIDIGDICTVSDTEGFFPNYGDITIQGQSGLEQSVCLSDIRSIPTTSFKLGETYTAHNGNKYKCINVNEDGSAHLTFDDRSPAYVWDADGRSLSLSSEWDIVFPPVIETKQHAVTVEGKRMTIVYKVIDGVPDTDHAQLVPF